MKKKKINTIDFLFEKLVEGFSQIKDFDKFFESEEGRKLFDLIMKSISELEAFKSLYLNYYIPASNKSIADSWGELSRSKYKHLLNINKEDIKENLYETIRLGYVGLFHKYESYLKSLINSVDFLLKELNEQNNLLDIEDYCKKEFKVNIYKSHDRFSITNRINYISNCIKHYDSYPIKEPIHSDFKNHDSNEKIKVDKDVFKSDIEKLQNHCNSLLTDIMFMGFKQYLDLDYEIIKESIKNELKESIETKDKLLEVQKNIELILYDFRK